MSNQKSGSFSRQSADDDGHLHRGRLLISCPDRPGIVAAVSQRLFARGANIIHSDQHSTDPWGGMFFMRIEFELPDLLQRGPELEADLSALAASFEIDWRLSYAARRKRIAVLVSREDHCLLELLWQKKAGDLQADIAMVISNHDRLRGIVESSGIPFYHVSVTSDTKRDAEAKQLELLQDKVDFVVLARYMQILSPEFVASFPSQIINIHHSFLPAFVGADPYSQAFARGVKLIGATAHYVTADLDAGPIIAQDVQPVNHRDRVADLRRKGRHIERVVLAKAVALHADDRLLVYENKTVVFG